MSEDERTGFGEKFNVAMKYGFPEPEKKTGEPVDENLAEKGFKLGVIADRGKFRQLVFDGSVEVRVINGIISEKGRLIAAGFDFSFMSEGLIKDVARIDTKSLGLIYKQQQTALYREWLARAIGLYEIFNDTDLAAITIEGEEVPFSDEAIERAWQSEGFLPELVVRNGETPRLAVRIANSEPHASGVSTLEA